MLRQFAKLKDVSALEKWRSIEEVSEYLGVKRDTLYKMISRKKLPAHKVGKLWKFKLTEVDRWVRSTNK
jgi:excisionase family DNA binding protein